MNDEYQGAPTEPGGGATPPSPQPPVPETPAPEPPAPGPTVAPAPEAPAPGVTAGPDDTTKLLAAAGYIVGIIAIVALLIDPYKAQAFSRLHAIQAIGLWIVGVVVTTGASILGFVPFIGWLIAIVGVLAGLAIFVFAVIAAIKAFQGEMYEMPVVYGIVKQYI